MNLLSKEGISLGSTSSEKEICRQIKEKLGEINSNPNQKNQLQRITYEMPDGNTILVGNARADCFEPLFSPQLCAMSCGGISQMIYQVLQSINCQTNDIILVGGTTLVKGMKERIQNEMKLLFNVDVNVISGNDNKWIPWLGAKVLDQQNIGKVITKEQWQSEGALCLDD